MWKYLFVDFKGNLSKNVDNVILWSGITVLVFIVYTLTNQKRRKLPPGPTGLPILGYYPFLAKKPVETLTKLAKKYGNVVGLHLGSQYVVFLNDYKAVKDALSQNATLDKPPSLFEDVPYKFGFGGANGAEWVETRRLASKVMKDALERNHWEDLLQEEMSETVSRLMQENTVDLLSFFRETFTNTVVSLVLGERLNVGNPITKMISNSVDSILDNLAAIELSNFSPKLSRFLQLLGFLEQPVGENSNEFYKYISDIVDSRIHNPSSGATDSFITRYYEEIDNRKKLKENSYITEDQLKGTVIVLLLGGSETTRTSMIWTLIAMADHPEIQSKVHEELDSVIGRDGSVRWSDRMKIPYTLATLLESMRWKTSVPFPVMRMAGQETQIQGFYIPKGTYIITNNYNIHNDSRYWKDPDQFIPERFLSEDGKKVNMAPESFNVFSHGKRNCPGKLLALMDMLQYFSTLMQKFKVVPKEGDKVKYEGVLGLSYQARNAELRFIPL